MLALDIYGFSISFYVLIFFFILKNGFHPYVQKQK